MRTPWRLLLPAVVRARVCRYWGWHEGVGCRSCGADGEPASHVGARRPKAHWRGPKGEVTRWTG